MSSAQIPEMAKKENFFYFGILILILLTILYYAYLKYYINPILFKYGLKVLIYIEDPMRWIRVNYKQIISIWLFILLIIIFILLLSNLQYYKK